MEARLALVPELVPVLVPELVLVLVLASEPALALVPELALALASELALVLASELALVLQPASALAFSRPPVFQASLTLLGVLALHAHEWAFAKLVAVCGLWNAFALDR